MSNLTDLKRRRICGLDRALGHHGSAVVKAQVHLVLTKVWQEILRNLSGELSIRRFAIRLDDGRHPKMFADQKEK